MKLWSLLKSAARNLLRKQQVESHLDEEVHAYVDLVTQESIRLPGAVCSSGTHLSPLPRRVGRPPHPRTQFLRRRGPSPRTEHGHSELWRVAKDFWRRQQYSRAQHSVKGRAVHRDRSAAR